MPYYLDIGLKTTRRNAFMTLDMVLIVVAATLVGVVVLELVVLAAIGGGSLSRLGLAWQALVAVLRDPGTAGRVAGLLHPPPPEPPKPVKPSAEILAKALQPVDVAEAVLAVAKLPPRVAIPEMQVMPTLL